MATMRLIFGSQARYTTPMAPRPIWALIWYRPRSLRTRVAMVSAWSGVRLILGDDAGQSTLYRTLLDYLSNPPSNRLRSQTRSATDGKRGLSTTVLRSYARAARKNQGQPEVGPAILTLTIADERNASFLGSNQRHVHQMLAQEPHLQFIGPQHIADRQVVGSIVA